MELSKKNNEPAKTEPIHKIALAEAKLMIDTSVARKEPVRTELKTAQTQSPQTETAVPTLGALSKIRQQFASRQVSDDNSIKPLQEEPLMQAWLHFTRSLRENKNSATQSFQRAELVIKNAQLFEVITNNNLEQKFIEQEKRNLTDYLQEVFKNKSITFIISIREKTSEEAPLERQLSKREQYQQMIEQYPFVKELKERLKLELDY